MNRSDSLREALMEKPTAEGIKSHIRAIKDISGQFVEDIDVILEKCGKSSYVVMVLHELVRKFTQNFKLSFFVKYAFLEFAGD